jgi:undecaprenyl-diphosphatase
LQLKDLADGGVATVSEADGIGLGAVAAGTVTAAIVGFFAVKFMLKIVREKSLWGFAVYVAILGALVLADQAGTHFFF